MNRPYKILIVDDNSDNLYSLKKTLHKAEYTFLEAHDGERALELVQSDNPDIILLDVRLPGLNGFQICEKVRDLSKHVPVVFVTANLKEFVDQVHGFEKGGDDYVIQPYDPKELTIKVKALLRNKRLYDDLLSEVQQLARVKSDLADHNEELKKVNVKLEEKNEHLKSLTVTDPLTALYNRKYFHQRIAKEISAVRRYKHNASAAIVDLVGYRKLNEEYGTPQSDVVLKELASLLVNSVRISDIVTRFDGGKFAIIFTHTPEESAMIKANMIIEAIHNYPFPIYEDLMPPEKLPLKENNIRIQAAIAITGLSQDWIKNEADLIEGLEITLQKCKQASLHNVVIARKN